MAGWDYYVLRPQESDDPKRLIEELARLGERSWDLVSVDQGILYFKRYSNYEAQLRVGVAAENQADEPLFTWVADEKSGERRINSLTSQNAGPGGTEHSHRVVAIVNRDMNVTRGATDTVSNHSHPVTMLGVVDEADGHTHVFNVE
jgi:hypothetical protein